MNRIQRTIFVTGFLLMTALLATVVSIVIHRSFQLRPWLTIAGPLGAFVSVIAFRRFLIRSGS